MVEAVVNLDFVCRDNRVRKPRPGVHRRTHYPLATRRKGVSVMSAFLVSMDSLNRIVATLSWLLKAHDCRMDAHRFAEVGIDGPKVANVL
jgi:hypothetical protein